MKKKVKYESSVKILAKDDYETTERKFLSYLARNPNDYKTQIALGNFYSEAKQYFAASEAINNVLEKLSSKIFSDVNSAHEYIDKKHFAKAANLYESALKYVDQTMKARDVLISLYSATKSEEKKKMIEDELNDIENTKFMYNFQLENIRTGLISEEEAHDILYNFMAPHYSHVSGKTLLKEITKNFKHIGSNILENQDFMELTKKENSPSDRTSNSSSHHTTQYSPELSIKNRAKFLHDLGISDGYVGMNKFSGYYMFQYKDLGITIFEKFYKTNKQKEIVPAYDNATYICPIDLDVHLSTYSKSRIISMMKTMPHLERVIHSKNYYKNLSEKIEKVKNAYPKKENSTTQADDNEAPELV